MVAGKMVVVFVMLALAGPRFVFDKMVKSHIVIPQTGSFMASLVSATTTTKNSLLVCHLIFDRRYRNVLEDTKMIKFTMSSFEPFQRERFAQVLFPLTMSEPDLIQSWHCQMPD